MMDFWNTKGLDPAWGIMAVTGCEEALVSGKELGFYI
jgi:hypothetical protein